MHRIISLVPVYKRPEVLEIVCKNLHEFNKRVKSWYFKPVFLLSPEDVYLRQNQKIVKRYGWKAIYFKNLPVSDKINAGIEYIYSYYSFDYLMNFGSDDLIHPNIEALYAPFLEKKVPLFGINTLYFVDMETKRTIFFDTYNTNGSIGAGRMIHRDVIRWFIENQYPLYDPGLDSGLDTSSAMNIKRNLNIVDVIVDSGEFPYVVDLKTNTNINHMMYLLERTRNYTDSTYELVSNHYPWI